MILVIWYVTLALIALTLAGAVYALHVALAARKREFLATRCVCCREDEAVHVDLCDGCWRDWQNMLVLEQHYEADMQAEADRVAEIDAWRVDNDYAYIGDAGDYAYDLDTDIEDLDEVMAREEA